MPGSRSSRGTGIVGPLGVGGRGLALQTHCKVSLNLSLGCMIRSAESFPFSVGPGVDHRDPV